MKKLILAIIALAVLGAAGYMAYNKYCEIKGCENKKGGPNPVVTNFKECEEAGYPVLESHPRRCTANGVTYTEQIQEEDKPTYSGIEGQVLIGPNCPIVRKPNSDECANKSYQTKLKITDKKTKDIVAQVESDENGFFKVNVPPGTYVILADEEGIKPPTLEPYEVTVKQYQHAQVELVFDTGIR